MILQTANLNPSGSKFSGEDPVEVFAWIPQEGDIITPSSPLRWRFIAKLFGSELLIEGRVSADFSGICARCGQNMTLTLSEPLCFSMPLTEEISEVDLTSELRDAILLALPNHQVCKPDCQGVCPSCGKPLSDGPCTCRGPSRPSAWDALDKLS